MDKAVASRIAVRTVLNAGHAQIPKTPAHTTGKHALFDFARPSTLHHQELLELMHVGKIFCIAPLKVFVYLFLPTRRSLLTVTAIRFSHQTFLFL